MLTSKWPLFGPMQLQVGAMAGHPSILKGTGVALVPAEAHETVINPSSGRFCYLLSLEKKQLVYSLPLQYVRILQGCHFGRKTKISSSFRYTWVRSRTSVSIGMHT